MSPMINFSVLQAVLNGPNSLLFLATVGGFLLFAIVHATLSDRRRAVSRRNVVEPARWSKDRPSGEPQRYYEQRRAS